MTPSPFSAFIKNRRSELGLSLKEASRRVGIQPSRIHDLEQGRNSTTGKPTEATRENIARLAKGYGLPEDYLLDLAGRPQIDATSSEEKRLLTFFRELTPGHRKVLLILADELFRSEQSS